MIMYDTIGTNESRKLKVTCFLLQILINSKNIRNISKVYNMVATSKLDKTD